MANQSTGEDTEVSHNAQAVETGESVTCVHTKRKAVQTLKGRLSKRDEDRFHERESGWKPMTAGAESDHPQARDPPASTPPIGVARSRAAPGSAHAREVAATTPTVPPPTRRLSPRLP